MDEQHASMYFTVCHVSIILYNILPLLNLAQYRMDCAGTGDETGANVKLRRTMKCNDKSYKNSR